MINATELFEKLVESGINFEARVAVRVRRNGRTYLPVSDGDFPESLSWLGTTASELYPDSEFAKWWRKNNEL